MTGLSNNTGRFFVVERSVRRRLFGLIYTDPFASVETGMTFPPKFTQLFQGDPLQQIKSKQKSGLENIDLQYGAIRYYINLY